MMCDISYLHSAIDCACYLTHKLKKKTTHFSLTVFSLINGMRILWKTYSSRSKSSRYDFYSQTQSNPMVPYLSNTYIHGFALNSFTHSLVSL